MNMIRSGLDELAVFLQFLTHGRIEAMLPSKNSRMPWLFFKSQHHAGAKNRLIGE